MDARIPVSFLRTVIGLLLITAGISGAAGAPADAGDDLAGTSIKHPVLIQQLFPVTVVNENCNQLNVAAAPAALVVHGIDTGMHSLGCTNDGANADLWFRLARDEAVSTAQQTANDAIWDRLVGQPWQYAHSDFVNAVPVDVVASAAATPALVTAGEQLYIRMFQVWQLVVGLLLVVAVWAVLVIAGSRSGLIRDRNSVANARSYSLSRVQMAWWFGIFFSAYVYLLITTGDIPQVNATALWLIGISGTTGLVATTVDSVGNKTMPAGQNLLSDILTDDSGVALHRFQLLVMSVVLGLGFLWQVILHLRMPTFDAPTLALLGISSSTYVGFKINESQTGTPPPAGAGAAGDSPAPAQDEAKAGYGTATGEP